MTSKEALNELLYYATLDDSGFEPYMKEYANQIEKDLEMLSKIINNIVEIDNNPNNADDYYFIILNKNKETRELLEQLKKEWLEK